MSTPTSPLPTGRRRVEGATTYIELQRTFRAPVEDVWAAVTEPERLARWIGTWTGDPASGHVLFRMTYEGDDVPEEDFRIDECEPPYRLRITTSMPQEGGEPESWRLRLDLAESDGVTTLTFAQDVADPTTAASVGPGWDYYLDRMQAAESGGDVAAVDFDAYYPALSEHYRSEFGSATAP